MRRRDRAGATTPAPMISIRSERPGVVLAVDGPLDERGVALLMEVVHAALLTVRRPDRIRIDVSRMDGASTHPSGFLRRLERAGATITGLAAPGAVRGSYG